MAVSKPSISSAHKLWANITRWGRNAPAYIVIHYTSGFSNNSDSIAGMTAAWKSYAERGSNAHYLVGKSAIWEMVNPKTHFCTYSCGSRVGKKNVCEVPGWGPSAYKGPLSMSHAGVAGHTNTINVEICSCKTGRKKCDPMDDGWYFSDETYMNAVQLVAWLCDEFGIKVTNIIMHNQITGKLCPAMWCNAPGAEAGFETFKQNVAMLLNEIEEDSPVPSPSPKPEGGVVNVAADSFFYSKPSTDAPIVAHAQAATILPYTVSKNGFYYTDSGWVQSA